MFSSVARFVPRVSSKVSSPKPRMAAPAKSIIPAKRLVATNFRSYSQKFAKTHEWVKVDGAIGTVGITAHAADALGEIVFVDLPKIGANYKKGSAFGAVESVKAASDIYTPVSGEIVEVNNLLTSKPDTVNKAPSSDGWMIKIKMSNPAETDELMDLAAYEKHAADDSH